MSAVQREVGSREGFQLTLICRMCIVTTIDLAVAKIENARSRLFTFRSMFPLLMKHLDLAYWDPGYNSEAS